jgi:hypothetical protein
MAMASNSAGFSRNGGTAVTASSLTTRSDSDRLLIGPGGASGSPGYPNGHISRLTYWPKRLTDTSLQYLTQ